MWCAYSINWNSGIGEKKGGLRHGRGKINRSWYLNGFGGWSYPWWFQRFWIRWLGFKTKIKVIEKGHSSGMRNNFIECFVFEFSLKLWIKKTDD